ncbi:A disintegrin and metalloproteinase with thrombospondin motifs 8 isoform X2 [Heterocephalus glaber]|uniref:A disintegrin and metalloproteinase with thrombospondin motifs 8 isoform X2 n=1 Tax=Heterocephalus glaber TaxID=10181 RepID=A0AAX6RRT8_HETGA|nr:A disintegrin and metalloproteinase with thrombospondin motifs 8 isoform X2 [Heterocephalus glaber]
MSKPGRRYKYEGLSSPLCAAQAGEEAGGAVRGRHAGLGRGTGARGSGRQLLALRSGGARRGAARGRRLRRWPGRPRVRLILFLERAAARPAPAPLLLFPRRPTAPMLPAAGAARWPPLLQLLRLLLLAPLSRSAPTVPGTGGASSELVVPTRLPSRADELAIHLSAFGQGFELRLAPDTSFLAPEFKIERLGGSGEEAGDERGLRDCFFSGTVNREPESLAAVSLCRGLSGSFLVAGEEFTIQPQGAGDSLDQPHLLRLWGPAAGEGQERGSEDPEEGDREDSGEAGGTRKLPPPSGPTNGTKAKRSVSEARFVETLVVADASMAALYSADLQNHILTLMSVAARIYKHPSIQNAINLVVVKVLIVEDEKWGPEVSDNGGLTLRNFCSWQRPFNKPSDRHPEHYDTAILLTRQDFCGNDGHCNTLGMADIGTICDPSMSCSVIKDEGLQAAYTVAHELGDCLLDAPTSALPFPTDLPGCRALYDLDQQCKQIFGPGYRHCPNTSEQDTCAQLWCQIDGDEGVCHTRNGSLHWADGTRCGPGSLCLDGSCLPKEEVERSKAVVDGGWTQWGTWGECSRTCGGGIQFSYRDCKDPQPQNGGKYCLGQRAKYQSCNTEECPPDGKSFREQQCEKYNAYNYTGLDGNLLQWVPKYSGVSPRDRCKLFCRARGRREFKVFEAKVIDGTLCGPETLAICVRGQCVKAGCDHVVDSPKKLDRCGVCGGTGSTCRKISGFFTPTRYGYNDIITIPAGATNIDVKQRSHPGIQNDGTYLALKTANGQYLLNGNLAISATEQDILVNGTILKYSGSMSSLERIQSFRPLSEALTVQLLTIPSELPSPKVKYTFFVPNDMDFSIQSSKERTTPNVIQPLFLTQ